MHIIASIEKLVFGGYGLARTDQGIIFVTDVAPGETVECEPIGKKGGCTVARPVKIISAASSRRTPPCQYAGICGGCDWLHLDYQTQVTIKKDIFLESLRRTGKIQEFPEIDVQTDAEFGYRLRAQFKIDSAQNIGFYKENSNEVVVISRCPLLVDPLNTLIENINSTLKTLMPKSDSLKVVSGDDGTIASDPVIQNRTFENVMITVGSRKFQVPGNGFFQSNRLLLERLGNWASAYCSGGRCVDLYGGVGFFSIMLAQYFKKGLLIESEELQAAHAKTNFLLNGIAHWNARHGFAEKYGAIAGSFPHDVLIIDPPRVGLSQKTREAIAMVKPSTILYISCDPATQSRDTGFLIAKAGYKISKAALFDLYPNTHHLETILLLQQ